MDRKECQDYIGTCQGCFAEHKVLPNRTMVFHGYTRDGKGYIDIDEACHGVHGLPFEYDCAITKRHIIGLRDDINKTKLYLNQLQSGEIEVLDIRESKRVKDGISYAQVFTKIDKSHNKWAESIEIEIANAVRRINNLTFHADYRQKRVDEWQRLPIFGFDTPETGVKRWLRNAWSPEYEEMKRREEEDRARKEAIPGKLKLCICWVILNETGCCQYAASWDDTKKIIKLWLRGLFPNGNMRVADGYEYELSRSYIKEDFILSDEFKGSVNRNKPNFGSAVNTNIKNKIDHTHVLNISLDWSYRNQILSIFSNAVKIQPANKRIEYYCEVTGHLPWNAEP